MRSEGAGAREAGRKDKLTWARASVAPTRGPLANLFLNDWPTTKLCDNRVDPWEARLRNEIGIKN